MAVGVVASLYHGVSGPLRPLLRKLDYWTICYTSNVLRTAADIRVPGVVRAATVALVPIKPTAVTGLNLALVEVRVQGLLAGMRAYGLRHAAETGKTASLWVKCGWIQALKRRRNGRDWAGWRGGFKSGFVARETL